jgi:1-acyl-sn-glycerol-3-phosphate acyltransferase
MSTTDDMLEMTPLYPHHAGQLSWINILSLPFRAVYRIYYLIMFALLMIVLFPFYKFLLADKKRFRAAFRVIRLHAWLLFLFGGTILIVKGKENIPREGAFIIAPNHTSFLDTFCLYRMFSRYFVFIGKKEIEKWPLFHIFYTSGMNILVDRHSKTGALQGLKRMSQEIDQGHPLMIFPEGTISKKVPALSEFKPGAFSLAIQKQIPVLPITFLTNWKRLQRGSLWKGKGSPGIARVIIHPPIPTKGLKKEDTEMLQNRVKDCISSALALA